jgi:hypothetical protein
LRWFGVSRTTLAASVMECITSIRVLWDLPASLITQILFEFVSFGDLVRFDTAICCSLDRPAYLSSVRGRVYRQAISLNNTFAAMAWIQARGLKPISIFIDEPQHQSLMVAGNDNVAMALLTFLEHDCAQSIRVVHLAMDWASMFAVSQRRRVLLNKLKTLETLRFDVGTVLGEVLLRRAKNLLVLAIVSHPGNPAVYSVLRSTQLRRLSLVRCSVPIKSLLNQPYLEELHLSCYPGLSPDSLQSVLRSCSRLRALSITGQVMRYELLEAIAKGSAATMRELVLESVLDRFGDGLRALSVRLKDLVKLELDFLPSFNVDKYGHLSAFIRNQNDLAQLRLTNLEVTDMFVDQLPLSLRVLDIATVGGFTKAAVGRLALRCAGLRFVVVAGESPSFGPCAMCRSVIQFWQGMRPELRFIEDRKEIPCIDAERAHVLFR